MAKRNEIYGLYCICGDCEQTQEKIRYVGQTSEGARVRLSKHRHSARNNKPWAVSRWMRKHGVENIRARVLQTVPTNAELDEAEGFWIGELETLIEQGGYNIRPGGESSRGYSHREDAKSRIKGPRHSEETRRKISESVRGRYGEESSNHKLTSGQVLAIRWGYLNGGTLVSLGAEFSSTPANIASIVDGSGWPSVPMVEGPRVETPTGKFAPGTQPASTKLTPEKVREIRRLSAQGLHRREIADKYGVTPENISMIVSRKTWKHVE